MSELHDDDEFSNHTGCERFYPELTVAEQQVLKSITNESDIKDVEVLSDWYDDHQICVGAKVNGVEFGVWWMGAKDAGSFWWPDSIPARQNIVSVIKNWIESHDEWCHTCGVHAAEGSIAHKEGCKDDGHD